MARYLNKVTLLGNLGGDPDIRSFQNGGRVASFSVATSEFWTDTHGERRERTTWHRIAIYTDGLIDVAEKYLRKGSKVYLEGKLEYREWTDQTDGKRTTTEVALRPFHGELVMLGEPNGRGDSNQVARGQREPARAFDPAGGREGYLPKGSGDLDDDVPFAPEVR